MSPVRLDGYEPLLDSPHAGCDEHHVARPSTTTVPLATGQPAAATAASNTTKQSAEDTVVSFFPASAGQALVQKLAPTLGAGQQTGLEEAPSAVDSWLEAQDVLRIWLGMAAGTVILCILDSVTGTTAGVSGIMGAVVGLLQRRRGQDLATSIKITYTCTVLATGMAIGASVLSFSYARKLSAICEGQDFCAGFATWSFIQGVWLAMYGISSGIVYKKAYHAWKLLNPVSSGMVEV